jgi:hypothetical protein
VATLYGLARGVQVSITAMKIRLETLGLIYVSEDRQIHPSRSEYLGQERKTALGFNPGAVVSPTIAATMVLVQVELQIIGTHRFDFAGENAADKFRAASAVAPPEGDGFQLAAGLVGDGVFLRAVFAGAVVEKKEGLSAVGEAETCAERPGVFG